MNAGRVSPSVALAAYAEAWISGAKVVVFGDALSPLAERLVERGARHVQVYDTDAARAAEATAASTLKQVAYAPLDLAGSSVRDGFFDVGIIEDLALAGKSPKDVLAPLSRALARRGLALVCSRNPGVTSRLIPCAVEVAEPLGYYDFYETVSQHFEEVRMLGQTPFVGYAIADFSASDASDVRLDTALLPGGAEEPEWFLALASALPVSPDAFSVIQLPISELDLGGRGETAESAENIEGRVAANQRAERAEAKVHELAEELARIAAERTRDAERHATERARDAERFAAERTRDTEKHAAERAQQAAERARDGEKQAATRSRDVDKREQDRLLTQKVARLEAELAKREEWARGLESRATTADQRADDAQGELERAHDDQRKLKAELEQLASEHKKLKAELARTEPQLEEERRSRQKLEEKARRHEQELEQRERRAQGEVKATADLTREHASLAKRVEELSAALAASEQKAKQLGESGDEETRAELLGLEAMLKERAAEVGRLTAALHETERFGRQLIVELGELRAARAAEPSEGPDVQALTVRNAELAADLEAARWTISSLEANVALDPTIDPRIDPTGAGAASPSTGAIGQRRDEIPPAEPHA